MKYIRILCLAVLLLALTACGDKGRPETPKDADTEKTEQSSGETTPEVQQPEKPAEPQLIAKALLPEEHATAQDKWTVPDFGLFCGREGNVDMALTEKKNGDCRIDITNAPMEAVLEYITLLQNEFGFEVVKTGSFRLDGDTPGPTGKYWDVHLNSTRVDVSQQVHNDCDLKVSGTYDAVIYASDFVVTDTGHRWSGITGGDTAQDFTGPRVMDEYWERGGVYYNGSDGKLSIASGLTTEYTLTVGDDNYYAYAGNAAAIVNGGETVPALAKLWKQTVTVGGIGGPKVDRYALTLEDYLPEEHGEQLRLTLPVYVQTGEVYRLCDYLSNHRRFLERGDFTFEYTANSRDESFLLQMPYDPAHDTVESLTVRLLDLDASGQRDSLLYVHAKVYVKGEPLDLEFLVCAPINIVENLDLAGGAGTIFLKAGETAELTVNSYVYSPNYETYEWKVASGGAVVIEKGVGKTCTVRAVASGNARVSCTYSYGVDEPDVLTGDMRNRNHVSTKSFRLQVE